MPNPPNISRNWISAVGVSLLMFSATQSASAGGAEQIIYSFQGGADGLDPYSTLIADKDGNLYGTTPVGGSGCEGGKCGTVFKLALDGTETTLYSFKGSLNGNTDGSQPYAGLVMDKAGNLYGTTLFGGDRNCHFGCGTVFRIAPDGTETVLYTFQGGNDGAYPYAGLIADKKSNLYGTTSGESTNNWGNGPGTIFRIAPDGTEKVLHVFTGDPDGSMPFSSLIRDKAGNFYGTTGKGGTANFGTVFKLTPDGTETILYSFQGTKNGGADAGEPVAALVEDKAGNFYGTAGVGKYDDGTVFRIAPDGKEKILHNFAGGSYGADPVAGLLLGKHGELYGTTTEGGGDCNCGTVFEVKK